MIDQVRATVSPEYFAHGLRPYFEDMTVGGEVRPVPAAAHIPLGLIDLALWALDSYGDQYTRSCADPPGTTHRRGVASIAHGRRVRHS